MFHQFSGETAEFPQHHESYSGVKQEEEKTGREWKVGESGESDP